jgi:FtsP/CotA-like multicopper oxidase with cupredoxin domain
MARPYGACRLYSEDVKRRAARAVRVALSQRLIATEGGPEYGIGEPYRKEFTRRHFLTGTAAVSATPPAAIAGYLITVMDVVAAAGTPTPAAGVMFNPWTHERTVPEPVLHIEQRDTVQFTLVNDATTGHSMDFQPARTQWYQNYAAIAPGASLEFDRTANFPGVFMYHCGTLSVLHHISNGMYGAVVVDRNFDGAMSVTP